MDILELVGDQLKKLSAFLKVMLTTVSPVAPVQGTKGSAS